MEVLLDPSCVESTAVAGAGDAGRVEGAVRPRVLYLFSGPERPGSLRDALLKHGLQCINLNIEAIPSTDLLDDQVWRDVEAGLRSGVYCAVFMSPPCSTFSAARDGVSGPSPLRDAEGPGLYGLADLDPAHLLVVRQRNWFAVTVAKLASICWEVHVPFGVENPARRPGKPSLFNLSEMQSLSELQGVVFKRFPQCQFGCFFEKPTEILGTLDLSAFESDCHCAVCEWVVPWNGEVHTRPHPPLRGKQMPILRKDWDVSMLRDSEPQGPYLTKSTAHYPAAMNAALAHAISQSVLSARPERERSAPEI